MLGKLARAAYVVIVAMMIVVWAMSAGKSGPAAPANDEVVVTWWC